MKAINSPTLDKQMSIEVDEPVGSMSISACGRDVILGSRKGLLIIDIDNPYDPPRFLPHLTTWEVADVQSSPHASRSFWIASTSNQKTIVWNLLLPSRNAIEFVLHSHSRAITDINWSTHHPDILATCSIDSYIHCWDLRDTKKPINSYCDWTAGSTQVKWNNQNQHILASSHGQFLRIWDDRYGAQPFKSIRVCEYSTKIYGIDFNRTKETKIITCSLDKSVCFWDYEKNENIPERIIRTNTPVWRARHTPFGWGIITMPQRDDNSLYLWDIQDENSAPVEPSAKFEGHTDIVKEFVWRYSETDDISKDTRRFQLITWSKDHHLRLWPISNEILKSTGHNPEKPVRFRMTHLGTEYKTYRHEPFIDQKDTSSLHIPISPQTKSTLRSSINNKTNTLFNRYKTVTGNHIHGEYMTKSIRSFKGVQPLAWMRGVHIERSINSNSAITWNIPENLGEELSWIGQKFPKVNFEEINVAGRKCTLTLNGPWGIDNTMIFIRLLVQFPFNYPNSATPDFELEKTLSLSEENYIEIKQSLNKISESYLKKKTPCLEICIRYLLGESVLSGKWISDSEGDSSSDDDQMFSLSGSIFLEKNVNNIVVPTPRKCAATFCFGKLVCFFQKKNESINRIISIFSEKENKTFESPNHYFESFGNIESFINNKIGISSEDLLLKYNSLNLDEETQTNTSLWRSRSFKRKNLKFYSYNNQNERYFNRRASNIRSEDYHGNILIQNISYLEPIKETLARSYKICGPSLEVCEHNAKIALKYDLLELYEVWTLIKMIISGVELRTYTNLFTNKDKTDTNLKLFIYKKEQEISNFRKPMQKEPSVYNKIRWDNHPFGQWLIDQIFSYYESLRDVQTLAMLSCVLDSVESSIFQTSVADTDLNEKIYSSSIPQNSHKISNKNNNLHNNVTSILEKCYNHDSFFENTRISQKHFFDHYLTYIKRNDSSDHETIPFEITLPISTEDRKSEHSQLHINQNHSLSVKMFNYQQLDDELIPFSFFSEERRHLKKFYRINYAEFLFRWKLYKKRAEILKFNSRSNNNETFFTTKKDTFVSDNKSVDCIKCSSDQSSLDKNYIICKQAIFFSNCIFCEVYVKGLVSGCIICSHGGHAKCMKNWFMQTKECPTGCGCECLLWTISKEESHDINLQNFQQSENFPKENDIKEIWCKPHNITIFKSKKLQSRHID
ncbi:hypothetical protein PNEG_00455 [Pneumocystis murina B123]|uniref:RWD domain-containing protein n=1 Tax=Pneumocystis murina (strain B123) TaxID=1069680 RepID=M7PC21_PNEMU|nr:hypothetical protein PNEG_00455 [Pneumocystis murina B123]EMR11435.1 hypothetical protein PNEG_00455 [Pneumocystis murina B123]